MRAPTFGPYIQCWMGGQPSAKEKLSATKCLGEYAVNLYSKTQKLTPLAKSPSQMMIGFHLGLTLKVDDGFKSVPQLVAKASEVAMP